MAWDLWNIFLKQPSSMKQEQTKSHKSQVMRISQRVTNFISLDGIANKILANPKSPWFTENCFRELVLNVHSCTQPPSHAVSTHMSYSVDLAHLVDKIPLNPKSSWFLEFCFISHVLFKHTRSDTSPRPCRCQKYVLLYIPCWLAKVSQGDVYLCNP